MKKTVVAITGGAGFIGSHLTEFWLEKGAEVRIIDNFRTGKRENIKFFSDAILYEGDIRDKSFVDKALEGVDYVHNLAAMISVPESIENPYECEEINIIGLLNLLEACVKHKVKKIIHSSSAAIYGDSPESPKIIDFAPNPKSPYGITKLCGEYYLNSYYFNKGLQGISLRYFNVFGPRQDPNSQYAAAIPIFVSKALKNEDITIYGDGAQTRDFIYVKDVARANYLSAVSNIPNGIFNVARGNSISIYELAKLIIQETNSRSKIIFAPERVGDIKHSLADIEKTKKKLNFNPEFNLIDGLKITIKYFRDLFQV
jgi:UDP-glucose 4-epimerase